MNDLLLKAENISYLVNVKEGFKHSSKTILENISLELFRGKITGVTGESGGGKTTLAKILAGVYKPSTGEVKIFFNGHSGRSNPVQILFQNNGELLNPFRFVQHILNEAVLINNSSADVNYEIKNLLSLVDLDAPILDKRCSELSGGQQQRIALARLLAVKPKLLILDEPFSAQDKSSQKKFKLLLMNLNKQLNISIVCISHDLNTLKEIADDLIILYRGKIVERGSAKNIFENPANNYTKYLLNASSLNLSYNDITSFYKQDE